MLYAAIEKSKALDLAPGPYLGRPGALWLFSASGSDLLAHAAENQNLGSGLQDGAQTLEPPDTMTFR